MGNIDNYVLVLIGLIVFMFFAIAITVLSRYRKCPSDKILVVYGKLGRDNQGNERSSKCLHGGAAFIWPVIQSFQYLDLTPLSIAVDLKSALSRQNIRIDVPSRFTIGISTEPGIMQNAAERLLGLSMGEVQDLARDIILGQLRLIIATMDIEEINSDRDKFLEAVSSNVESELKKIGLRLINVNITDIIDESGYIMSLGREAAAKAINDAKRTVALHDKAGAIGEAEARRDQRIQISLAEAEAVKGEQEAAAKAVNDAKRTVALHDKEGAIGEAEARRDQRIQISSAEAEAIKGENEAKMNMALSNAERREREAEALKRATAAEKVQQALADEEAYRAQRAAELSRAELEQAKMQADIIVKANVEKERLQIEAEAEAEQIRRKAAGQAEAMLKELTAQAKGNYEALANQAEGITRLVEAAGGNAQMAVQLMMAEKIDELMKIQVEAIKNIKIDRVTVWDSMGGDGKSPATANFLSGMMKSIPPLNEMFKMAGMEIPAYLGKEIDKTTTENTANTEQ